MKITDVSNNLLQESGSGRMIQEKKYGIRFLAITKQFMFLSAVDIISFLLAT